MTPVVAILLIILSSCAAPASSAPVESARPVEGPGFLLFETVSQGDFEPLADVDVTNPSLTILRQEDPSYPYTLALALERAGDMERAHAVLRSEVVRGVAPWNGFSANRLAALAMEDNNFLAAEGHARGGVELLPGFTDLWYHLGEAVYRQGEYEALLEVIGEIDRGGHSIVHRFTPQSLQAERLLWEAVARWELPGPHEAAFTAAFVGAPAGPIHGRLYLFLQHREEGFSTFTPRDRALIEGVYRIANNEASAGWQQLRTINPAEMARLLNQHPSLVQTLRRGIAGVDTAADQWLQQVSALYSPQGPRGLSEDMALLMARVAERGGRIPEARSILITAGTFTEAVQLSIRQTDDLRVVLPEMIELRIPEGDLVILVDRLLPVMVRQQLWSDIDQLYRLVPATYPAIRAHLGVVTTAAASAGLLPPVDSSRLDAALELDVLSYNRVVAHHLRQIPFTADTAGVVVPPHRDWAPELRHARAFLYAHHVETARAMAMSAALRPEAAPAALGFAREASRFGHFTVALDVGRRAVNRGNLPITAEEISILFPMPYFDKITAAAGLYDVDAPVFFGLIREESHFNSRARSHVGATGLSQIMPATAADLQRRLRWDAADLLSVTDNTTMGAFYLDYLRGQLPESLIFQLGAYNAGLGRGRTWRREFGDLPALLQIEGLPFIETRWYLRRIFVSAGWYNHLLQGSDVALDNPLLQ